MGLVVVGVPALANRDSALAGKVIALDAGHGGRDRGAVKETPDVTVNEKEVDLEVATLLKERLEVSGARVALTRTGDETVSLEQRVARADTAKADVLVSIH